MIHFKCSLNLVTILKVVSYIKIISCLMLYNLGFGLLSRCFFSFKKQLFCSKFVKAMLLVCKRYLLRMQKDTFYDVIAILLQL